MPDFAYRLKQLRTERKITQKELANVLNVSQNAIFNWENGKREPSMDTISRIAEYFDVSLEYLLTGEEQRHYYLNEETAQIAQEIFENPDMRSLFDMSRKMTPERLKAHLDFMKRLQESEQAVEYTTQQIAKSVKDNHIQIVKKGQADKPITKPLIFSNDINAAHEPGKLEKMQADAENLKRPED